MYSILVLFFCVVLCGATPVFNNTFNTFMEVFLPGLSALNHELLNSGLFDTTPVLKLYPMPKEHEPDNRLIWYASNRPDNMIYWQDSINIFLEDYVHPKIMENSQDCTFDRPADDGKYCWFRVESLYNCSPGRTDTKYGFPLNQPCIYLTLSKVFDWTPRVFNETDLSDIKNEEERLQYQKMPQYLKEAMFHTRDPKQRNLVWVSCEGESPADVEHLGPVSYSPLRGFPSYYFPYKNVPGYQSPIVAIQFERPKRGIVINIICKVWAKNLINRTESIRFALMID